MGIFRSLLFKSDKKSPSSSNFVTINFTTSAVTDLSLTGYIQNSKDGTKTGFSVKFTESTRSVKIPVNDVGDLIHFERSDSYVRFNIINGATILSQDDLVFNAKIDSFPCTIEVTYNKPTIGVSDQQGTLSFGYQAQPNGPNIIFMMFLTPQTIYFNPKYISTPSCRILLSDGTDITSSLSPQPIITSEYIQITSNTTFARIPSAPYQGQVTWHTSGDAHI